MATKKTTNKATQTTKSASAPKGTKSAAQKTAPKTSAKDAPAQSETTTRKPAQTASNHPKSKKPTKEILHYDKEMVVGEYTKTYKIMMIATAASIGTILLYFLVFIVYLGGVSHTKHDPFYEKFNDRIDLSIDYDGKPLPKYENE